MLSPTSDDPGARSDTPPDEAGRAGDARSMRILHLVARSHRRGAELVAVELAEELDRRGHRNRVVALGPATDGGHEIGMPPLADSVGLGARDLLTRVRKVRRLLAEEPFDVVLAHGGWPAQIVALAAPRSGGPALVWQRILGFPPGVWRPGRQWWWRWVAGRFDAGVALTAALEAELRRLRFGGPVWIIPNSRRPDRFVGLDRGLAATRLRAEIGVADDVPLIGFVGHLVEQKRPDQALEVLARVLEGGHRVHLVVAGDGPLRPDLEAEARRRGLAAAVTFLGHRPDVEWVFGGVELMLLTSDAEGIPGVAIESLMAGCPVVSYPVGGVDEVVDDDVTGVLLASHDPGPMAEAVVRLLDDDATREAMSRAGRLEIDRFSASTTAETYDARLTALLSRR
jgi:glycosyltransferase involved in cell wall biosynthesis